MRSIISFNLELISMVASLLIGGVNQHAEQVSATKPNKSAGSGCIHFLCQEGNTRTPSLVTTYNRPSPPTTQTRPLPSKSYIKSKPRIKGMSLQIPEPALRSFTELHTEQMYLLNTLQQQNHQATQILRKIPPLEEKLLQEHPSYIRRRVKKQIAWFKHRLDETTRQEQTILARLSQLTFEIQSQERLAQIENEHRQTQLYLSLSSPVTPLSTSFSLNWAYTSVSSNYIPQVQLPTSPSDFLSPISPTYMGLGQRMQAVQQILNAASPVFHPQNHQSYGSLTTGPSTPLVPTPMAPTPISFHSITIKPTTPSYYADYNWHSKASIYPTSTAAALSILNTSRDPSPRQKDFDSEEERDGDVVSNQIYDPSSRSSSRRASMLATTGRPRPASMENLAQALERALMDERPKRHSLPASGSRRTSFPSLPGLNEIWKPTVDEQNEIEIENKQQKDKEEQKEVDKDNDEGESRSEDEDGDEKGEKGKKKVE